VSLSDFIRKQFLDILQWTEGEDGVLAWAGRRSLSDHQVLHRAVGRGHLVDGRSQHLLVDAETHLEIGKSFEQVRNRCRRLAVRRRGQLP